MKQKFLLLSLCLLLGAALISGDALPLTTQPAAQSVFGDVNGDGVIDVDDLNIVINIMVKKADDTPAADLNGDGVIDIDDLNIIINIIVKKYNPDPILVGDVNGDGVVDVDDLNIIINIMLKKSADVPAADVNGDGVVDIDDLNTVINVMLHKFDPSQAEICLVVWHKDGTRLLYGLTERPKITYQGDKVLIKGSTTLECDFTAIKKMMFLPVARAAVSAVAPMVSNHTTLVYLPDGSDLHISLLADDGAMLYHFEASSDAPAVIPIGDCTATARTLNVNGITYRISKK